MKKLGLVGCGHIHTPDFVRRLQARNDVAVTKVWDHDRVRANMNGEALSASVVDDPAAVWSDETLAAVIICSETDRHEPLVVAGCAAGKDLFVEKPLGMGAADSVAMAQALENAGVLFQTGYFKRGLPYIQFLKDAIQQGYFGKITRMRLSNCHRGSLTDLFTPDWLWMTDPAVAGVGAFGDLGTHALDLLLLLTGEAPLVDVTGSVDTGIARYGEKCDEYGEAILRFEDGMLGTLAAGWVDLVDPVKLILSGTEGYAHVIGDRLYIKSESLGLTELTEWTDLPPKRPHAFELFLDAVVAGHAEPGMLVTPAEAARRSVVMEKIYQAAAERRWVTV